MRGFYFCQNCKAFVETLTTVRTKNERKGKIEIPFCCQCRLSTSIKEVEPKKFSRKSFKLWISLYRTYIIRGKEKKIKLSVKFLK